VGFGAVLGRDCCEQVERKCWDDNKEVFDKFVSSAGHNELVVIVELK
jgi:hypothetical protein